MSKDKKMKKLFFIIFTSFILFSCHHNYTTKQDIEELAKETYQNKDYSTCIDLYTRLIVLDSTNGHYYFRRGVSNLSLSNEDSAMSDFQTCIRLGFNKSSAYYNIGLLHEISRDDDSAVFYYTKSLDIDSTNSNAIENKERCERILNLRKQWHRETTIKAD